MTTSEPGHGHVHEVRPVFDWATEELYNEEAERAAVWCDLCGWFHDWRAPCAP